MMPFAPTKTATKGRQIETLPESPILYLPLSAYHGHHSQPLVQAGDKVLKYQLLAKAEGHLSANVHAPVSGEVVGIEEFADPSGRVAPMLVLRNDFENACIDIPEAFSNDLSLESVLGIFAEAGIVGEGGAQFPTAMKYRTAAKHVHAFIINGVECEAYLTADYALMRERTAKLFEGIHLINKLLNASQVVIVIGDDNLNLEPIFAPYLAKERYAEYRVQVVPEVYPQGSERQVTYAVTGQEISPPKHHSVEGYVVSNVGTIIAAYEALVNRLPVVNRIVTISGESIEKTGNYEVPIGTPVGFLLNQLGISPQQHTIVLGGPMMGQAISDWASPITKGSGGILALPREPIKRENCIECGRCIEACPMGLMPLKYDEGWRRGNTAMLKRYQLSVCFECGACEAVCPANVPLIASIKAGKALLQQGEGP